MLCLLTILDVITTLYALSLGAIEMNPLMRYVIGVHPLLFAALKLSVLPLCLWLRDKQSYRWVCAAYGVVVLNNILIGVILW